MLGFDDDLEQQMPSFLSDYWYLIVLSILLQALGIKLYKRVNRISDDSKTTSWLKQIIIFPLVVAFLIVIGRGGFGLKPISAPNAAAYTIDQNVQLVLNSAFTVIKTWGDITLEEKHYFGKKLNTKLNFNSILQFENL